MYEIVSSRTDRVDLGLVDVEADDRQATLMQCVCKRKADIAESDDADLCAAILDAGKQVGGDTIHDFGQWSSSATVLTIRPDHEPIVGNPQAIGRPQSTLIRGARRCSLPSALNRHRSARLVAPAGRTDAGQHAHAGRADVLARQFIEAKLPSLPFEAQ